MIELLLRQPQRGQRKPQELPKRPELLPKRPSIKPAGSYYDHRPSTPSIPPLPFSTFVNSNYLLFTGKWLKLRLIWRKSRRSLVPLAVLSGGSRGSYTSRRNSCPPPREALPPRSEEATKTPFILTLNYCMYHSRSFHFCLNIDDGNQLLLLLLLFNSKA